MTHQPFIQTHSARAFPLLSPTPDDVDWRDVSVSLGRLARFNGHSLAFYSVAQHSLSVEALVTSAIRGNSDALSNRDLTALMRASRIDVVDILHDAIKAARRDDGASRRLSLAALLHDAHEAYIGDITSPVADALTRCAGGTNHIKALKARIDGAIHAAAGLPSPLPAGWSAAIRAADLIMLATERRDLMLDGPWTQILPAPAPRGLTAWSEHRATDAFAARLDCLFDGAGGAQPFMTGI
jgi:hypothetical protein